MSTNQTIITPDSSRCILPATLVGEPKRKGALIPVLSTQSGKGNRTRWSARNRVLVSLKPARPPPCRHAYFLEM